LDPEPVPDPLDRGTDTDPHQNVTDPQHWLKDLAVVNEAMKTVCMEERIRNFKVGMVMKFYRQFLIFIPPQKYFLENL
jgi:hypothetical protein